MHQDLRLFSLFGILSLTLLSLSGCGEKRINVSTASGAPGEEMALEPLDESSDGSSSASLATSLLDELDLFSQSPGDTNATGENSENAGNEPINMVHASPQLPPQENSLLDNSPTENSSHSFPSENEHATPGESAGLSDNLPSNVETGLTENEGDFDPLANGQSLSAQSSSSPSNFENTGEPDTAFDSTATQFTEESPNMFPDAFSGEDVEPIPDTFQIAKAEPSAGLQERLNRIKQEELAASAAGLEDVFFKFDSWTLTEEGKQSLQRILGWFEQESSSNLIIEGHADQRGTQAYNMVLAKKRAVAVHDYLSQLGVKTSRLAVISYGKDKPFCQDTTEVCYQLNRRGHLVVANQ